MACSHSASKDHRPDVPQVKVMLATLDPLGMPLAADVVPGQCTDDPLYLPTIARVRASLGRTDLLYIGDCTLGTVGNWAGIHHAGDHYLCPLRAVQVPAAILAALVEAALAEAALATPPTLPTVTRLSDNGKPVVIATRTEDTVTLTARVDDEPVTWTERRLLVRSHAHAAAQARGLHRRLVQAEADLSDLLVARRGKVRPTTPTDREVAVTAILTAQQVSGMLTVTTEVTAHTRTIRPYRGQPAREETTYDLALTTTRDREEITAAEARLGWRVYATTRPVDQLSLAHAVMAYREEYLIEHSLGRLKGAPLSLRPVYLSRDDHTTGLIRLLTIGVRVLTVLEYAIRQRLADTCHRQRPVCLPASRTAPSPALPLSVCGRRFAT